MDQAAIIELLDKIEEIHPHVVDFKGRGSAGRTPRDIPGAWEWLHENVPDDDWEWVTYFGTLTIYFTDKGKAALFRTFFQ